MVDGRCERRTAEDGRWWVDGKYVHVENEQIKAFASTYVPRPTQAKSAQVMDVLQIVMILA